MVPDFVLQLGNTIFVWQFKEPSKLFIDLIS